MKKFFCVILACILLSFALIPSASANTDINVFEFLYFYGGYYSIMSDKNNIPSSYFCYPSGSQGIYMNTDSTLLVMFSCAENQSFGVTTVSCSSETDLLSQLFATVYTIKTLNNPFGDSSAMTDESLELAFRFSLMKNGEMLEYNEFTVGNIDGSIIFALK
jgi:hypothetical protein